MLTIKKTAISGGFFDGHVEIESHISGISQYLNASSYIQ